MGVPSPTPGPARDPGGGGVWPGGQSTRLGTGGGREVEPGGREDAQTYVTLVK